MGGGEGLSPQGKWISLMRQGLKEQGHEQAGPHLLPPTDGEESAAAENWERVRVRLKSALGAGAFASWFGSLSLSGVEDQCVTLNVPSKFIRDWITAHYEDRLRGFWRDEDASINSIRLVLRSQNANVHPFSNSDAQAPRHVSARTMNAEEAELNQVSRSALAAPSGRPGSVRTASGDGVVAHLPAAGLGTPLDPRYTFDGFVVGKSNELAYEAARRVAEQGPVAFNPLYLYAPVGLGKTHLLHAIAWEIRRKDPTQTLLYLSAERFMYHFVRAVKAKDTLSFKDQLRAVDVLLLDDVQFIAHKGSTQEEFFHTFNALLEENRQVVISSNQPPADLDGVGERIRSRLGQGLSVDIKPTDYALRVEILAKKVGQMRRNRESGAIPTPVIEFLARSIDSNVRVLEGALNRLAAYADYADRPISLDAAKDILTDLLRSSTRKITIADIQRGVVDYYAITQKDLVSARRAREVVRPRHVAMYLCKQLTTRSFLEIGRKFGGRDHSTVYHAVKRVTDLMISDEAVAHDVGRLTRRLQG